MKSPIILTLAALCLTANIASAQPRFGMGNRDGVQLRDSPGFGPLLRAPALRPPLPQRDGNLRTSIHLRSLKTPDGEMLQVEATNQSIGQVLRRITSVMGARAVVEPALDKRSYPNMVFRGADWDKLLLNLARSLQIEMVKSPAGVYFFAVAPASKGFTVYGQLPDGTYRNQGESGQTGDLFRQVRPSPPAPFLLDPNPETYGIDPDFVMPTRPRMLRPQPDWDKGEFNGREFYHIPLPVQ